MEKLNSNHQINLGYACINTELRKKNIFTSRTLRKATFDSKGLEYVKDLVAKNLKDMVKILDWNKENNVNFFRMSSEIFPFISHPDYHYQLDFAEELLYDVGKKANENKIRLTFHPGQFNQLSSHRPEVVKNTISDLNCHNQILEKINADKQSVLVLHGGSKQGGKKEAMKRFCTHFSSLPEELRTRIVLENCEMCYSIDDLLPVCQKLRIPLVLDYHHHSINPGNTPIRKNMQNILKTWEYKSIKPKFHLSQSPPDVKESDSIIKRRKHSDFITLDHFENIDFPNISFDLMLETKSKEQSVKKIKEFYQNI